MNRRIDTYLDRHGLDGPWSIEGVEEKRFRYAVVIPALAEHATLFLTLDSLSTNPPELLADCLVLVVVNHRAAVGTPQRLENLATLAKLSRYAPDSALQLGWVDAASPGKELPNRRGGVGMARKLGFDLTLAQLDPNPHSFIASLDADTLVRPDYLPALAEHFVRHPDSAAVIPYCHQPAQTAARQVAIERYELYLRHYTLGLSLAGSPYAYHSIGSALACSPTAYLNCGGMNCRQAGEDFYLLQQLQKTAGVHQLQGTVVYPSARGSDRVPFGTGERVERLVQGDTAAVRFYAADCFRTLSTWLQLVNDNLEESGDRLLERLAEVTPAATDYLRQAGFAASWQRLRQNHRLPAQRLRAFHTWFDALRSLRMIHHLTATTWPSVAPAAAIVPLLDWAGWSTVDKPAELLVLLRSRQTGEHASAANCPTLHQPRS